MPKVWLVTRHEFLATVGRPSYRIISGAIPLLGILGLIILALLQTIGKDDAPQRVRSGFVDLTQDEAGQPTFTGFRTQDEVTFLPFEGTGAATQALLAGNIDRLYVIPEDFLASGIIHQVVEQRAGIPDIGGDGPANLNTTPLGKFVLNNLFVGDVELDRAQRILVPYRIATISIDEAGAVVEDPPDRGKILFFMGVGVLLMVSVFTTAGYLLQGLTEEKENRIMEVLLSSLRPEQLMLGKLFGLGAAGLLQMTIWTVSGIGSFVVLRSMVDIPAAIAIVPSADAVGIALVYFVLGYALYGTLMAALGAVTTSQREASQVTFLIVLPGIAPMWFMTPILENPEGPLARALSLFPLTAPLTSLVRLGVDGMGALDLVASVAVLAVGVALVVLLTLRLFRTSLLMTGQRPGLGQILRTLRSG